MASSHKLLPVLPFWTPTDLQSCISEFRELYVVTETLFTVFEQIAMKLVCLVCGTSTIFVIVERHLQQTAQTCYKLYLNREKTTSCSAGNDQILVVKRYFLVQRQILQVNVKLERYIYIQYIDGQIQRFSTLTGVLGWRCQQTSKNTSSPLVNSRHLRLCGHFSLEESSVVCLSDC